MDSLQSLTNTLPIYYIESKNLQKTRDFIWHNHDIVAIFCICVLYIAKMLYKGTVGFSKFWIVYLLKKFKIQSYPYSQNMAEIPRQLVII